MKKIKNDKEALIEALQLRIYSQGIRDAMVSGVIDKAFSESKNSRESRPYNEGWKFGIKLCDEKEEIDRQVNR